MRVRITFESDSEIKVSRDYHRTLQGLVYSLLDPETATDLHENGSPFGKRRFKMFTFSRLIGTYQRYGGYTVFNHPVDFYISSSNQGFLSELCQNLTRNPNVELEVNKLHCKCILLEPAKEPTGKCVTLSPITVYSTLYTGDRRKKTYYYSPYEPEFSTLISRNLVKKSIILGRPVVGDVKLHVIRASEVVESFKGTIIKAWKGCFSISGPKDLLSIAYDTGLGSKNSTGHGMIDFVRV